MTKHEFLHILCTLLDQDEHAEVVLEDDAIRIYASYTGAFPLLFCPLTYVYCKDAQPAVALDQHRQAAYWLFPYGDLGWQIVEASDYRGCSAWGENMMDLRIALLKATNLFPFGIDSAMIPASIQGAT